MKKHWHIRQPDPKKVTRLSKTLNCYPVTAAVLVNRGILTEKAAYDFINVSLKNLHPPFALKETNAAVHRIYEAIMANEKILIFGDYDVDGITSTVLLSDFFQHIGADVTYYIPHRVTEGYGIQSRHITEHAVPNHISLIITADCGSSSHQAVESARDFGIDIIITDHHNIAENIPPALAVINPKRKDCTAGLEHLAGVGVAFCLLISLRKYLRDKGFWQNRQEPNLKNLCDLVALGTVADMVPLVADNRIFCKTGLEVIVSGRRPGLSALMEVSAIYKDYADAEDIAFRLAPRINAAGRIDHASKAVELLTAADAIRAASLAADLDALNQKRKQQEKQIIEHIQGHLKLSPKLLAQTSLVLAQPGWHAGVLGIVASRITEMYNRPAILIAIEEGLGKGSARSIPGLNLYESLVQCSDHLESFGGHAMAAGLTIREERIPDFQNALEKVIQRQSQGKDLVPKIWIDTELEFAQISGALIDELESLMPFGAGNPEPLFMARGIEVVTSKKVGKYHRRMVLRQSTGNPQPTFTAIHFNVDEQTFQKDRFDQIVFKLQWNRWNGRKTAQIVIEDQR